MPISSTSPAWLLLLRNIVRGTPMSLFSLPTLLSMAPNGVKQALISSRVVVLPAEPVTATTGQWSWRRQAKAIC